MKTTIAKRLNLQVQADDSNELSKEEKEACIEIINKTFISNSDKIAKGSKFWKWNISGLPDYETKNTILNAKFFFSVGKHTIEFDTHLDGNNLDELQFKILTFDSEVFLGVGHGTPAKENLPIAEAYYAILKTNGKAFVDTLWRAKKLIDMKFD